MGFALVDLIDYWVQAPGSISTSPERTFWYAVRRAVWMGTQFLVQFNEHRGDSLDEMVENGREPVTPFDPDEALVEGEHEAFAASVRARLSDGRATWLDGLAAGLTTREEAEVVGVSQQAVCQRRKAAIQEARDAARADGLL